MRLFDVRRAIVVAFSMAASLALTSVASAKEVKIKLGTLAPEGSPWHNSLKKMGERFKEASGNQVSLTIYPGGVAGDEGDMVRKMRIGQLHAATITGVGLSRVTRSSFAFQIPMAIESYEELDYIRDRIGPKIAEEMEKAGFIVLAWGDAGWVHFFSKSKAVTPDEFRKLKMFAWSGDPEAERAWKASKFTPIPMSATDVLSGLQTGLIDWVGTTPVYALTAQWFGPAKYMLHLRWAALSGATIVTKKQWEQIDEPTRTKLLAIANEEGAALRAIVRKMDDEAITAMKNRGLIVTEPDAATVEAWRQVSTLAHPEIRGKVVPEGIFDETLRLSKEFRSSKK